MNGVAQNAYLFGPRMCVCTHACYLGFGSLVYNCKFVMDFRILINNE